MFEEEEEEEDDSVCAEDELLNLKIQQEESTETPTGGLLTGGLLKPKKDLEKYSSYRALSGPTSFDVFSLVKTPSAVNLDHNNKDAPPLMFRKDAPLRKSAEFINRKTSERSRLNRCSMIESSTLSSSHPHTRHRMRSAKSMEAVNHRRRYFETPTPYGDAVNVTPRISFSTINNISLIDLKKHDNSGDATLCREDATDDSTVVSDTECKNVGTDSDTLGPRQQTYVVNVGTMKSDATTMTDPQELEATGPPPGPLGPLQQTPLYGCRAGGGAGQSPDAIQQWLENGKCEGTDSDYSSTFYKTSRSSSVTELNQPLRSSVSDCAHTQQQQQQHGGRSREKEILDSMVMIPLKGGNTTTTSPRKPSSSNTNSTKRTRKKKRRRYDNNHHHRSDSDEEERGASELSEGGYSASEEDIVDSEGRVLDARTKSRRKKTRRRSGNMSKVSQYVTLDDQPSAHVSFV